MKEIVLPSLSEDGYVTDVAKQLDLLLTYFFTSEYSQTVLYKGQIYSLQYLVYEFGENTLKLRSAIQDNLTDLFNRYFDSNTVLVDITDGEVSDVGTYGVSVDATVTKNGENYNLGKSISIMNSRVSQIVENLNG